MVIQRPPIGEYAPFFAGYVSLVVETDILGVLESQPVELGRYAVAVPAEKESDRYAPEKWSLRQVFSHLIDGERVFGYRAFCISHGEQADLPSFDENEYMKLSDAPGRTLGELTDEFSQVRASNLFFLRRLGSNDWLRIGKASGNPISVRALAFIMGGHVRHHLGILRSRYGVRPVA